MWCHYFFYPLILSLIITLVTAGEKQPIKKKDVRDYTDADLERLYEQWEEADEPLEPDELPEHKRPPPAMPSFDPSMLGSMKPDEIMKMSKKGKPTMLFATVAGNPPQEERERISQLWQSQLHNAHIEAQRFDIGDDRFIFMFQDGSQAFEAKDFLVSQEQCAEVTLENQAYPGKGKPRSENEKSKKEL